MATPNTHETDDTKTQRQPRSPAAADPKADGNTRTEQSGESSPRLPHERDESSDSQSNQDGSSSATELGKRAHDDVERGVVDTTRGAETDRVYNDKVKP